jgi:hypothetical protein
MLKMLTVADIYHIRCTASYRIAELVSVREAFMGKFLNIPGKNQEGVINILPPGT